MIERIVRMTFSQETPPAFLALFEDRKERIRHFDGCMHLALWQDIKDPHVYFTYSHWEDEQALDRYRYSDFFKETWGLTRVLFAQKPDAWSIRQVVSVL